MSIRARGRFRKLATGIVVDEEILAPVRTGQRVGVVNIRLDGEVIAERPLVALGEMPKGGLWRRMSDYVKLWFR